MDTSQFGDMQSHDDMQEQVVSSGATCDAYRVKIYGKLHFLKRLKPEYAADIRYREALQKEFETGYRLEHPYLVNYISMDGDAILMEYIDGETLTQKLESNPDYFRNRRNADKFLRQLLSALQYLHSHQVLHLDLKPDNIMLTRIGNDVKLIDLGCCLTDTFADTPGRTDKYAAPEQFNRGLPDQRTDIYAIGRILEQLPCRHLYNKVISHCTQEQKEARYQSVEELSQALFTHPRRPFLFSILAILLSLCIIAWFLLPHSQPSPVPSPPSTTSTPVPDSIVEPQVPAPVSNTVRSVPKTITLPEERMHEEMHQAVMKAYEATLATFCDSVFPPQTPSPSAGKAWETATTAFNDSVMSIASTLAKHYPSIPRLDIDGEANQYVQRLIGQTFAVMRKNGEAEKE